MAKHKRRKPSFAKQLNQNLPRRSGTKRLAQNKQDKRKALAKGKFPKPDAKERTRVREGNAYETIYYRFEGTDSLPDVDELIYLARDDEGTPWSALIVMGSGPKHGNQYFGTTWNNPIATLREFRFQQRRTYARDIVALEDEEGADIWIDVRLRKPIKNKPKQLTRCPARNRKNKRCLKPNKHSGRHQVKRK